VAEIVATVRVVRAALVAGAAFALALAALWVLLTALTGKTYHLAPGLIAWAPGLTFGLLRPELTDGATRRARLGMAAIASTVGLVAVAAGWTVIAVEGIAPTATVFAAQPGGVGGEIVLAALLGALLGARRVARRSGPGRDKQSRSGPGDGARAHVARGHRDRA
jgi:uncharacterized membrane protein AbrB (regulator of aidB expression)